MKEGLIQGAILIVDDRIMAVDREEEVARHPYAERAETLVMEGQSIIPGLTDAHVHFTAYARQKKGLYLFDTGSKEEVLERLRLYATDTDPEEWINGYHFKEIKWENPEIPSRQDLDALDIPNPVHLARICGHLHVANTKAMELAGINRPVGFNGIFYEEEADRIVKLMEESLYSPDSIVDVLREASDEFARYGITSIHACGASSYGLGEDYWAIQTLINRGCFPLRVTFYDENFPAMSIMSGFGDDMLRYGGLKIFLDGAMGARSAALTEPYSDDPGNKGILNHSLEKVIQMLKEARKRRLQVQVHAIGDAAIDQFIQAALAVENDDNNPFGYPLRLNHVQLCRPDQISDLLRLRVPCDIQLGQLPSDIPMIIPRLGEKRKNYGYLGKTLLDKGFIVSGSSDAGCEILNPWRGIWASVNRIDDSGYPEGGWKPEEKMTLPQALQTYTENPPLVVGMGNKIGKLVPGMKADLVVLDRDIFAMPSSRLQEVSSLYTFMDGRLSFGEIQGWPSYRGPVLTNDKKKGGSNEDPAIT